MSDHGPGVPEALGPSIFDRGARADPDRGTGLGLHVSRRLLRQQLGDLSLLSHGRGSTFAMRLPAAPPTGHADDGTGRPDRR